MKKERRNLITGLFFISPWAIGLLTLTAYPIIASAIYSLCDYDGHSSPHFVGLANYKNLLFHDPLFWKSLTNTLFMVGVALPITLAFCLFVAIILNQKLKGEAIYRTIFYVPTILPMVAVSALWIWLFNPEIGLLNTILKHLGFAGVGWLSDPKVAKISLTIMGLWGIGGTMLIFLAALQNVPDELYEAADIDGASWIAKQWNITIPVISPVILFNLIMGLIGYFQYFTQAFVMTSGGPLDSTLFYALKIFNEAFVNWRFGYASAMAWILFIITLLCTYLVMRYSRHWVYYQDAGREES